MTLPQVMHALAADGMDDRQEIERLVFEKQSEILDRVLERTGWRARRLLELPVSEITLQIQSETGAKAPPLDVLPGVMARYIDRAI